ncbi:PfkB family carbohydrate kinase [Pseudooceanicola sp.]|uniref:PfkB family carbohydrate kinase n=1 Tax=Pseudooceanicola sp. TaxID=1914328 RepID=UPI002608502C|nr:PfkB family carbohydrate kinase [Pseudooceanicola sp.]MDF1857086.1 PfkB family carbohydrate kinase [Pseudooceanicola sp.]
MSQTPDILCIGAVLWDIIGRTASHMVRGSDMPGRITRLPGGVAMNIAMATRRFGMRPALLGVIGRDAEGEELIAVCRAMGMEMRHVYRSDDLPTDRYMAVEGGNGLIAAIADAHSLEAAGARILAPLRGGDLGAADRPWRGSIALDGNLKSELLRDIAADPAFAAADLRIAPASPGKAERLHVFLGHPSAVFYVNREEAGLLCQTRFADSFSAARALHARGAARAIVTDGGNPASEASAAGLISRPPAEVLVTRVTGAGDTFMAAHMAAEARGNTPEAAMEHALNAAADYVSGDTAL